jgi:hypothetical protein
MMAETSAKKPESSRAAARKQRFKELEAKKDVESMKAKISHFI